jgi:hypothetical protein
LKIPIREQIKKDEIPIHSPVKNIPPKSPAIALPPSSHDSMYMTDPSRPTPASPGAPNEKSRTRKQKIGKMRD